LNQLSWKNAPQSRSILGDYYSRCSYSKTNKPCSDFWGGALAILTEVVRLNIHPGTATASKRLAGTGQSIQQQLLGTDTALREVKLHIIASCCNRCSNRDTKHSNCYQFHQRKKMKSMDSTVEAGASLQWRSNISLCLAVIETASVV
jgi:hypothetical protein